MGAQGRSHAFVPHTADAGLVAQAPTLAELFEEGALALAELAADTADAAGAPVHVGPLAADDLAGLAFAWLNELIGITESEGRALVRAQVERLERTADGWTIAGAAFLAPYDAPSVRARRQVKAVSFHRLAVEEGPAGYVLTAYVDL